MINNSVIILLTFPHFFPSSWWYFHFNSIGIQHPKALSANAFTWCIFIMIFWLSHQIYICLRNTKFYAMYYMYISCIPTCRLTASLMSIWESRLPVLSMPYSQLSLSRSYSVMEWFTIIIVKIAFRQSFSTCLSCLFSTDVGQVLCTRHWINLQTRPESSNYVPQAKSGLHWVF
jgi:hypothetical protein